MHKYPQSEIPIYKMIETPIQVYERFNGFYQIPLGTRFFVMDRILFADNHLIFLISILISFFTSVITLDLLSMAARQKQSRKKKQGLATSAFIMGAGIWSMHYTAQLSGETGEKIIYSAPAMVISLIAVILLSYASFYIFTSRDPAFFALVSAAVLLGIGITLMHYIGTYSIAANLLISYNSVFIILTIITAISLSFISMFFFTKTMYGHFSPFHIPATALLASCLCLTHVLSMKSMTLQKTVIPGTWDFSIPFGTVLAGMIIINLGMIGWMHMIGIKERKRHMTFYDPLTGLPNQIKFLQQLNESVLRCRKSGRQLAVLFIDLDRFKWINDTMGHEYGDTLLKKIGERLTGHLPSHCVVARHGGDEFMVLLDDIDESLVTETARHLANVLAKPFIINEKKWFATTSMGISLFPKDGDTGSLLIRKAYQAMLSAQKKGYNQMQLYKLEQDKASCRNAKIEQGLKQALHHNEFELYYQPQVHLNSRKIVGVEALLRWRHPELGPISPYEFIPAAENSGMIIPIGNWVIQEACRQIRLWQAAGIRIKIAVNVSALQFEDHQFIELIHESLNKNLLPPKYLELEITESVMQKINQSFTVIRKLKNIGIKVSIDDFGTGYSSLSVLSSLPIDVVKIDKSFVQKMVDHPNTASVVKTIIEMGNNLDFGLIAEGIETEEQANFLLQNGCSLGQGYLYSPPLSQVEIEGLLSKEYVI
ncbi:putative bifunctional diguanylate cyclase/phosphodiesterase [Siminovitchia sediminis]|uniref:Bifunctional diguanylate cyclase/phosphodiesterase n=1 Tax=Siminovitchia sediminis TaxID=1274353 RepID=A0ABW4KKY4_9BACI